MPDQIEDETTLHCGHCFCYTCLLEALDEQESQFCPVCQTEFSEDASSFRTNSHPSKSDQEVVSTTPREVLTSSLDQRVFKPSTKVKALVSHLQELFASSTTEKCIVFSQWTTFLDLLEIALSKEKIRFCRFDGKLNPSRKQKAVDSFEKSRRMRVMLMSLRAGGVGLNLAAASHVFIMDPWYCFVKLRAQVLLTLR